MPNMELKKSPMPVQDAYARICNFDEVALGYTYETAVNEAKRCLNCKHKPCVSGCPVEIDIPGKFSIYNSLTAIAICRHFKVDEEAIKKVLLQAKVKGRIEMIKVSDQFTLLIHYAHNAMALESLLTTLREYEPHRLVSLFGCGGNRSRQRRFEMGEVSGKLADLTIITSDNPRFEEPQDIIDDIKTGMAKTDGNYVEICDRKEAITYAIEHGEPGDIIVLAGKGHEDYQEIRGVKHPMDERDLIRDILAEGHIPGSAAK